MKDAQHWRDHQNAAQRIAADLNDADLRRIMLGMAAAFGTLVILTEQWERAVMRNPPEK